MAGPVESGRRDVTADREAMVRGRRRRRLAENASFYVVVVVAARYALQGMVSRPYVRAIRATMRFMNKFYAYYALFYGTHAFYRC